MTIFCPLPLGFTQDALELPIAAPQNIQDFTDFLALILFISVCDGVFNAVTYVITQNFLFGAPERGANCGNLCDDVNAVAVLFNHPGKTADLALDSIEPFLHSGFYICLHA